MKNLKSIALALVVVLTTTAISAQTKNINTSTSVVEWVGKKVIGKHNGTVNFKEGNVVFTGKNLTGGTFVVDMTSLTATDLTGTDRDKLNGHLKADDFFGTDKYPTATLTFKKIDKKSSKIYNVTADLTVKGITKPVNFVMSLKGNTANASFNVDRTKYDIKYNSKSVFGSIGDKAINDEFELKVSLKF